MSPVGSLLTLVLPTPSWLNLKGTRLLAALHPTPLYFPSLNACVPHFSWHWVPWILYISGGAGSFSEKTGREGCAKPCSLPPWKSALAKRRGLSGWSQLHFVAASDGLVSTFFSTPLVKSCLFISLWFLPRMAQHHTNNRSFCRYMPYMDTSVWTYPRYSLDFFFPTSFPCPV